MRLSFFLLFLLPSMVYSQIGGQQSFEYLNIPSNTRLVGLGGINVSLANQDVNLAFSNPALSGDTLSGLASFNYQNYFADAGVFSGVYQHDFGKLGSWFIGINHVDYGEFEGFDATGDVIGDFSAGETVIAIGRSHSIGLFTVGGSLKFLNSAIAGFNANALVMDIGGVFVHPKKELTVGLVFKNIGVVVSDYDELSESQLPFDVQAGISFKPQFMPFRFSFTGYNLTQGDITYFNANDPAAEEAGVFDNALRHINIGAELLLSNNINLRFGYNHLVRQELRLEETAGGAGFSFGLMFRIKAFEFSYSRGGYHASGGSNVFGLVANTNMFLKNRKK